MIVNEKLVTKDRQMNARFIAKCMVVVFYHALAFRLNLGHLSKSIVSIIIRYSVYIILA